MMMETPATPIITISDLEKEQFYQQAKQYVITRSMNDKMIVCLQNKLSSDEINSSFESSVKKSFFITKHE